MRLLRTALILCATTAAPVQANRDACLSAPTAASVFDLALTAADEADHLRQRARTVLIVVTPQDSIRDARSAETLDVLLAAWQDGLLSIGDGLHFDGTLAPFLDNAIARGDAAQL